MIKCFALTSASYVMRLCFVNVARDTINAFLLYMRLEIKDKSETDIYYNKFRNMHFTACYTIYITLHCITSHHSVIENHRISRLRTTFVSSIFSIEPIHNLSNIFFFHHDFNVLYAICKFA